MDDNFDDIDLDELFNDFTDEPTSKARRAPLANSDLNRSVHHRDMIECSEQDCTAPRVARKPVKTRKKAKGKQMTMYDYASSISYRYKQFYSSLDNTTSAKTIVRGTKRPQPVGNSDGLPCKSTAKKSQMTDDAYPSLTPPDFIDNLLRYLDQRSHATQQIPDDRPSSKHEPKARKRTKPIQ